MERPVDRGIDIEDREVAGLSGEILDLAVPLQKSPYTCNNIVTAMLCFDT